MILVTGATGNVGGEVVRALAAGGAPARALARHPSRAAVPAGTEVVAGDLADPATLGPALTGARALFLLGGFPDMPGVLAAARAAGVERVVLLTSRCVDGGRPDNAVTAMWLTAEAAVRDSGLAWTVLHPSGFHSNALRWLPQLRRGDVVAAPWPDVAIASIDPADIAAVAATVLTGDGAHDGRTLALSGPAAETPGQQVATLAAVLGRPLRYEALPDDEARAAMLADTPPAIVDALFRFFSAGEFDDSPVVGTVAEITGRPARPLAAWARDHAGAFADAAAPAGRSRTSGRPPDA